ncbi:hypothetical protein TKK_0007297 [Trichogramma kaykai]|uniref:Vitellogenin domain-containing protein n=1 Tax=Trichogramma kaykai TaxID=54128 RepID=A0ABD2X905_9HYME
MSRNMAVIAVFGLVSVIISYLTIEANGYPYLNNSTRTLIKNQVSDSAYIYKYSTVVLVGQNEPKEFASKLYLQGKLIIKPQANHDSKTDWYIKFQDVVHTIHNGPNNNGIDESEYRILDNHLKEFETPFLLIIDSDTSGFKIQQHESLWSRNMKKAILSLMNFDVDLTNLNTRKLQNTIYGDCEVNYSFNEGMSTEMFLRAVYEPRKCSKYVQHVTSDERSTSCHVKKEEDLMTSVENLYELNINLNEIPHLPLLLKKITSHEKAAYLPWLHRSSGVQYVDIKQTVEFEMLANASEVNLPQIDFEKVPIMSDLSFESTENLDFMLISKNLTQSDFVEKVQDYLSMMANYLKNNHFEVNNYPHKNLLKKLTQTMRYLNTESIEAIFEDVQKKVEKDALYEKIREIFVKLIPHIGTEASWDFTYKLTNNLINAPTIDEITKLDMISKLPMYVINPTEEFAKKMIRFRLTKTGVLCYSILLNKVYKNVKRSSVPTFLKEQLEFFNSAVSSEITYQAKILYIMAMRNVEVGNIYNYLAPMVRGNYEFEINVDIPKTDKFRMAAMWAVAKSISNDRDLTYKLFWPILSNSSESLSMRITAYEQLVSKNPILDINLLMSVHWLMDKERDEHMFNYHYTSLKNMAEWKDPCKFDVSELARKVFRIMKPRKSMSKSLSGVNILDYYDDKYGYGMSLKFGVEIDENTGTPEMGFFEVIDSVARKSKMKSSYYWNVNGINLYTVNKFFKKMMQIETSEVIPEQSLLEITNEEVKNLIRQTQGYKLLDKNMHVELWTMKKGYVTQVDVFFDSSLTGLVQRLYDDYKTTNLMDIGDKLGFNRLYDIDYLNNYRMVVPTSAGLPAIFYNEAAQLFNIKLTPDLQLYKTVVTVKLEFEARYFYHSSYEMKVYNPFAEVTHSVERCASTDIVLPLDMTVGFNLETRNLKIVLPRMPLTKLSTTGLKIHASDMVTIGEDYKNVLKTYCSACKHNIPVKLTPENVQNHISAYHSLDTGLEYAFVVFDCDYNRKHMLQEELSRVLNTPLNDANDDLWPKFALMMQHALFNNINVLYTTNCGIILKASPSNEYPTATVEFNWRLNAEQLADDNVHVVIRGTVETKAVDTNITTRFWNVDTELEITQFHSNYKLSLTPGHDDFKVCFEAHKEYPNFVETLKHETLTKLFLTLGKSKSNDCVDGETLIKVTARGELLDDQIKQIKENIKPNSCFSNTGNPLDLNINERFDWNCLYEAVKLTTMRKYTYDIQYQKIPTWIQMKLLVLDDFLRFEAYPHIHYNINHTEPGHMKVLVTYSDDYLMKISLTNPSYTLELYDIEYGPENGADNNLILDNTAFSNNFLMDFYKGDIRPCIAHADDVITDLNQTIPIDFKEWTLISGDYGLMTYAIFVKAVSTDNVAVKIFAGMYVLEVQPTVSKPIVTINGVIVNDYEKGVLSPNINKKYFKISMFNQLLVIETEKYSQVKVYYTPNNVIVLPHLTSVKTIDGICGHMGSRTFTQDIPLIYKSSS